MKHLFAWAGRLTELYWVRSMRRWLRDLRLLLAHRAEAVRIVEALGQLREAHDNPALRQRYHAAGKPAPQLAPYEARRNLNGYQQCLARAAARTLLEPLREIAESGAFIAAFGVEDMLIEFGRRAVAQRCLPRFRATDMNDQRARVIAGALRDGAMGLRTWDSLDRLIQSAPWSQTQPLASFIPRSAHLPIDRLADEALYCVMDAAYERAGTECLSTLPDPVLFVAIFAAICTYYRCLFEGYKRCAQGDPMPFAVVAMTEAAAVVEAGLVEAGAQTLDQLESWHRLPFALLPRAPLPPSFTINPLAIGWIFADITRLGLGASAPTCDAPVRPPMAHAHFDDERFLRPPPACADEEP